MSPRSFQSPTIPIMALRRSSTHLCFAGCRGPQTEWESGITSAVCHASDPGGIRSSRDCRRCPSRFRLPRASRAAVRRSRSGIGRAPPHGRVPIRWFALAAPCPEGSSRGGRRGRFASEAQSYCASPRSFHRICFSIPIRTGASRPAMSMRRTRRRTFSSVRRR